MATQVITSQDSELPTTAVYSGSLSELLSCLDMGELVEDGQELAISTGRAVSGARGVLVALALEGGVMLAAFFAWQIVHSLR